MSHSLNSSKGGYIGDDIGAYYRGILGVKTVTHIMVTLIKFLKQQRMHLESAG